MADAPLSKLIADLIEKMTPGLGLDRWQIKLQVGPGEETAACAAMHEYRVATIHVDPDNLDTGDELDETVAHELGHCLLAPIASAADDLRIAVGELVPELQRAALNRYIEEQNRRAEEETATSCGRAFVTLFRALWATEADLAAARAEVRTLKKQLAATGA